MGFGSGFDPACHEPEQVAEAVQVDDDLGIAELIGFLKGADAPFRATGGGAGDVESGGIGGSAGGGPAFVGDFLGFEGGDELVEFLGQAGADRGIAIGDIACEVIHGGGEFAHHRDQVLLDGEQAFAKEGVPGGGAGQSKGGVEFIDGAVGFDTRVTLRNAAIVHQSGAAVIAGAGCNAHEWVANESATMGQSGLGATGN